MLDPTLAQPEPEHRPGSTSAVPEQVPDQVPPRHRRPLTDARRARGIRTARVTKALVAATFVAVFVCTPEVITAMTQGFTTIFTGQGIEDVAPARVPQPDPQPQP